MSVRWAKMLDHLSEAGNAARQGFAGVQLPVGVIASLSEEELRRQMEILDTLGLGVEICTAPLPAGVTVTQKGFNIYVWTEYLERAVKRLAGIGCEKIAWSDGRARVLPLEGDTSDARQQALQFLAMLCDVSAQHNTSVLVEPLGPRRTNFLNSMQEVADFIPLTRKTNLLSMLSLRELSEIEFKESDFERYAQLIAHVQMENPQADITRREPPRVDDGYDYLPFLHALRRIRYEGTITLPPTADSASLRYCQGLWDQSS